MRSTRIGKPFDARNWRPDKHIIHDKILDNTQIISNLSIFKDNRQLAGPFSESGEQIFSLGNRKVNLITTGPWNEILMLENEAQNIKFEKSFP